VEVENLQNLVETARQAGSFSTLIKAIQAAGLEEVLSGSESYTVCAPNDAAFDALPAGTFDNLMKNRDELAKILKYHVVAGKHRSDEVRMLRTVRTLQGSEVPISVRGNDLWIGESRVIKPDIEAANGIIHVMDRVLIPK
jgi:uncharacterized surface protein with fasciclin (FAS1) repeats